MKQIESVSPENSEGLVDEVKDFWSRNINAEKLMGRSVTEHERGSDGYFADLEKQRYRSHRHLLPWIESMEPGKSVLEIGCGVGLDSYQMAMHGLNVTGIDLTDVAIAEVRKRFARKELDARFKVGDAGNLAFDDETFDYVYSFGVLHHAPDTEKTIQETHRVLKPGGEARIMLYNRHSLNELMHRIFRVPFEDKDELCPVVRRFTKNEVRAMCKDFRSVDIDVDHVYGEGYGKVFTLTPSPVYKLLSRYLGWHLMVVATK